MQLRETLQPTAFNFERGYGRESIPYTGDVNRPVSAIWWTKEAVLDHPSLEYRPGKIFLGRVDRKMIGLADDRHVVTVAGSRGGKSTCLLIPNLKLYEGSALVIDPKGELAAKTASYRATRLGHAVHVLDPWGVSGEDTLPFRGAFDPLEDLRHDRANLIDNANLVADALIIQNDKDPHWTDAARALVRALVLFMVLDSESAGGSIAELPALLARVATEAAGTVGATSLLAGLAALQLDDAGGEDRPAWAIVRSQAAMMLATPSKERASILSTARTQLVFLESPAMATALAGSALRLADLKRHPTTIYLCLPASRMGTHHRWLRLVIDLAVAALEQERTQPRQPVLFVLEEFSALGPMRALEQAVAYMAGFGVKLWAVLQDLTQLKRHYPDAWETFLGNAGFIQAFSVSDLTTCEYLSKRLGQTTFQITNKIEVGSDQALKGDSGLRREFRTAPLLAPDEIARKFARRSDGQGGAAGGLSLVLVAGAHPFVCERVFHEDIVE